MKFKNLKQGQLFEYQPEGRGSVYEIVKVDEGNTGDYAWQNIILGNVNNKKIVSVPFADFTQSDWLLLEGYKYEVIYEKVKYLVLPSGERHVMFRGLAEQTNEGLKLSSSLKNVPAPKVNVSKGIKNILYKQAAEKKTVMSQAMTQAVEKVEPVAQPAVDPAVEYEVRDLTRIRTLTYDDLDYLGRIYLTCDPEYYLAKKKFMHKVSQITHEQCLDLFRSGDINMYDLRLRQYRINARSDGQGNISYHMLLLRLGKAIYKCGTSQEKKEFGIYG